MQIEKLTEGLQIVGVKKAPSKDHSRVYTTYYCIAAWSAYELDNTDYLLSGVPVEIVQTTEDFPLNLGDVVKFFYGKAIGNWQPVTDYKLISSNNVPVEKTPFASGKASK
jgi:hypothetical protein